MILCGFMDLKGEPRPFRGTSITATNGRQTCALTLNCLNRHQLYMADNVLPPPPGAQANQVVAAQDPNNPVQNNNPAQNNNVAQNNAAQNNAPPNDAAQNNVAQNDAAQNNVAQNDAAQNNVAQNDAANNVAQHNAAPNDAHGAQNNANEAQNEQAPPAGHTDEVTFSNVDLVIFCLVGFVPCSSVFVT